MSLVRSPTAGDDELLDLARTLETPAPSVSPELMEREAAARGAAADAQSRYRLLSPDPDSTRALGARQPRDYLLVDIAPDPLTRLRCGADSDLREPTRGNTRKRRLRALLLAEAAGESPLAVRDLP